MRMWGISPKFMCNKHLLGEHLEMHMFAGSIDKGISVQGYIDKGLVDTCRIQKRHDDLAIEMSNRGINHKSPLVYVDCLNQQSVNDKTSKEELFRRCYDCETRYKTIVQEILRSPNTERYDSQSAVSLEAMADYAYVSKHKYCSHLTEAQVNNFQLVQEDRFRKKYPHHLKE